MTSSDLNQTGKLSLEVSRLIRAPRERVFDAWIKPELRRKWWSSEEEGELLTACEIDARVGGRYCQKQIGSCDESDAPKDYEWIMQGEFQEIVPPARLVFTWTVNHPGEAADEELVTVTFAEVEGGTEVTIKHEGIATTVLRDGTEKGWTELLERQAVVLK
jgi:uncharacterized protein YndB with AHSA1/START domain